MSLTEFEVLDKLGKGAFASVYKVRRKKDSQIYAMKRVNFGTMKTKEKDNALNEVRILASVQHPNIIGYKESFYDDQTKTLNIIMEFADEGDIDGKIKKHIERKTNFPENEIWSYLIQVLQGLRALHNAKIMHRDLKSANIFIKSGIIKLGDLNVSKLIKRLGMDHTQTGTPYYASPEVWGDKPYDYKCDIWSVGCIIYELCALKPPFRANDMSGLYRAI
jgi:NIMA (never in mitosis gene a)-related kinase